MNGKPFPWDDVMAFGLGRLKLSPRAFWAMTPRELAAAMSVFSAPVSAPERSALAELMNRFPDRKVG